MSQTSHAGHTLGETQHNPCATCGACCRSYIVPVCGYDVWLISTRQLLGPEQFLVACPQSEPGLDGFRLDAAGPAYGLALDKRGRLHPKQPCIFLMDLAGGTSRCGIYAHRPVVCQSYPMSMMSGAVVQRKEALCPPEAWPAAEVARPAWRRALQAMRMHFDIYHEVVARWNARVAAVVAATQGDRFALLEYFSYLLNVYERLALLEAQTGEHHLRRVQESWPLPPRRPEELVEQAMRTNAPSWLEYLRRARHIIDRFYPEIAPQPVLVFAPAP